jgi:putative membrane protein
MNKAIALTLLGLALGTGAVVWLGVGHIVHTVMKIGWIGLFCVVAWQCAVFVLLGTAWWTLVPEIPLPIVTWGRLVREGGETCLPFSEVGGLIFGARAIMLSGVDYTEAGASSIVDVICEGIALVPFLLFGLVMLLARKPGSSLILPLAAGLAVLVAGGGVAFLLRRRLARLLRDGAARLLRPWVKDSPERAGAIERATDELFRRYRRIISASLVHLLSWFGGGGNVWITYHLLGATPSFLDAFAIESTLSGALAISFMVPAGLGVQELTYVGVGGLFGMPAHLSLSLSLIRRARDIVIGAPSLLLWQAFEARKLHRGDADA